jgi:hypothetical protein
MFPQHNIHKYTWTPPVGKTHNQTVAVENRTSTLVHHADKCISYVSITLVDGYVNCGIGDVTCK